jgi:hypothetical protein
VIDVVDQTVTSGLGADQAASKGAALASEDTLPAVALRPVCTKEVSDLASADADVARWYVCVRAW